MVGSHVIETYSGQSYTSFVEERIFAPLGMTSTTFSPAKAEASGNFTQGWTKQGRRLPEFFDEETAISMAGPGGVISNAVDMVGLYTPLLGSFLTHQMCVAGQVGLDVDQRGCSRQSDGFSGICVPERIPLLLYCLRSPEYSGTISWWIWHGLVPQLVPRTRREKWI